MTLHDDPARNAPDDAGTAGNARAEDTVGNAHPNGKHPSNERAVPLNSLREDTRARIAFVSTRFRKSADRLGSFGVVPGSIVRLHQKRPSVVIELHGTHLALDGDVANDIWVHPCDGVVR